MRKAKVFVEENLAGTLIEDNDGQFIFTYNNDYDGDSISLTLPLNSKPYKSNILFPFFDGLIPEGWILEKIVKNWKLNIKDRMELLINCCIDCVGNVRIEKDE